MNKGRYRLVYSEEHGSYVPVPEETSARSKGQGGRALRRLVAAMAAALPGLSIANPTGHQVMQGQVGIQQQGGTLNITASDKAIIHWKQFSIQPGETTRFIQPNATATVLNRVVGQDPSQILGNLIANGRVFLINPNGVLFGAGAKVDTAGLVASTLNIKNEDFNAGRLKFEAEGAAGKIRNEGSLKTTGGPLLLIAIDIENTGLITAENGDIVLAAGKSVEIADPHQPALRVRIEAGGEAINLGQLIAKGGNAGMFGAALTQAGKISATGAQRTADGRIVLRGTKSVTLTETSETTARTADGNGGAIEISAPEVKIEAKAVVDASGIQGGRIDVTAGQRATVDGTLRATGKLPAPPAAAPAPADIEMPVTAAGPAPAPAVQPVADAGKGGHIQVTADTVAIGGSATLDASGDTGGGSVLVGGDWQGANPLVRNAQVSWVGSGARLLADALLDGDGGKVVVWADQASAFHGNIWARGGRDGGNGGQVEVSGKVALLYRGRTDTSAARGRNGSLLLDPLSIVIQGGSGDGANDGNLSYNGGTAGTITAESLGPTVVYESELEEQSKTTDIILRAQRSVTVGNAQFNYTASGNASGETAGQLTLATGSSLLIETRNLGAGEGGVSAGIDLVTGGWHGAGLRIVTQGSGSITMQTGYSNGTQVGDQRADIVLPVLQTASGGILARAGSTSVIDLRGISYRSGGTISMQAGTVSGGTAFNGAGGTEITGNYLLSGGTVSFDGGNASISGLLTLNGNLGGASALSMGGLLWQGGQMLAGGRVTLNGAGQIDGSNAYRYLDRRLDVAGQFDLANSTGYELIVRNGGELHLNAGATLSSTTADGMIRLAAGTGGSALLSGDAGSRIAIAAGRSLQLNTDSAAGSTIAGQFDTSGDGALIVANGRLSTAADTTFTGSGILRLLSGGTLSGSHRLTLGNRFEWQGGLLDGSGTTVLSGTGVVDNSSSYHYLARTLQVDGTLTLGNSSGYLLYINDGGRLHLGATGTLSTDGSAAYIYMNAGATGVARLSGDTGARVVIGDGAQLYLRTDNTGGNRLSGTLNIGGAGVLTLDSGSVSVTDTALLTGSGTVRLSNGGDIGGAGTLTLAANFDWRGGSMSNAAGTTILAGSSSIDNTSGYKYIGRRVVLTGSLTMGNSSGYYLQIHNGGNLHLAAGSRLATSTASGMIYLAAGTGGAALSADAGSAITAAAGTVLTLQSDGNAGNTLAGRFTFDGAGEVRMPSGQFTTAAATTFAGNGLLRLNGATLNLLHTTEFASPLVFESGIIAGSGSVLLSGDSRWTSGTMSGTGTTTVTGRLQIDNNAGYKFLGRQLVIDSQLDFGASTGYYLQLNTGGRLHLNAGATLSTNSSTAVIYMAGGSGGNATFSADDGARVAVASGADLFLRSDGTNGNRIAGNFELTGAGDLVLDSGMLQTGAATVIDGIGRLRLSGSATLNAEHALSIDSVFRFDGGVLGGSAATTLSGAFTWAGGTMAGTGTTTIAGSGTVDNTAGYKFLNRRLTVTGSLMFGNSSGYYLQLNNGGRLHVAANATLGTGSADGVIYLASGSGGSALISADSGSNIQLATGTTLVLRADNAGSNGIAGNFNLTGNGTLHLDSGTLSADAATAFTGDGRLLLSGGGTLAGSGLITIASVFDWTGGSMAGTGTTRLLRDVSLSGSGARHLNRTLEIAAGRTLSLGDNVTLQRSTSNGGTGGIVAQGTLLKSAGTGTAYVTYLDLSGNIASSSGVLSIYGNAVGTSLNGVNASTSGSGALRLDSGLFTLTNGQTFTVSGGRVELSGATLSTSGSTSITGGGVFALTAGTLNGTGTLNVTSGFDWTGGTMSGTGTTRLDTSVTLTGSGTRTLDRTLEIAAGRTLDLDDNVLIQRSTSSGGTGGIVALGTVRKAGGTGTAYLRYLDLSGNISANRGVLSIYGNSAGSRIAGAVLSSNGGSLRADSGTLLLNAGESAQIASGTFELSGATLTATGNSSLDGAGTFSFTSGTINGPGTLTVNTATDWSGGNMAGSGITRLAGAARILSGSTRGLGRTLEIAGSTVASNLSGAVQIQDGARISVLSGGTLELNNSAVFSHLGSGRIDNAGLLLKTGSDSASLAMPVGNTGTLRVAEGSLSANGFTTNAGTLDLRAGSTLTTGSLQNNGVIQGSGTINLGAGTLTNAGIVRPGDASGTGTLTVTGQFVQTAGGRIEADVLGATAAQQDHLVVSGSAQLDGALVLTPANGLTFGASDRYTVLSCGADGCLSGAFASVNTGGLAVTPTTFSNAISFATGTIASTWISQTSGFWDVAANWAGGLIPTASTDVVIDQAGDLTVTVRATSPASNFTVNSLRSNENIAITGSTLTLRGDSVINGRLSMTGGTLTIGSQLEVGAMTLNGGTVSGGRLIAAGTGNVLGNGTLSALQLMLGSRLTSTGNGTLSNVTVSRLGSGSDAGRIVIANGSDLRVAGTLTLDNGSVTLASDGSSTFLRSTSGAWSIAGNGSILFGGSHNAVRASNYLGYGSGAYSLSIGAGVTVAGSNGGYIYFGNNGANAGTIEAATAGREIVVNAWNNTDTWNNTGTLRANGGMLSLNDAWSSAGNGARIQLDSGTLFLGGSFSTASFNTLVRPADADRGALNLVGTLNNANATLNLNGATGTLNSGGTIAGGTLAIDNASGGAFNTGYAGVSGSSFGGSNSAALDNVRLSGSTTVANGGDLRVIGTLTLDNGSVTLASDGSSTFLRSTSGAWSIAGNGSILFGGSHNAVRASNYLGYGSGAYSLSIGAGVTVAGSNGGYIYFGNNGANAGTIEAATAGREIVVNAWNNTDTWNNTGTLRANGGMLSLNDAWSSAGNGARIQLDSGTLFLGGSFSTASFNTLVRPADADRGALNLVGTLNNANATLNLNGATGTLNSGGTIAGGTLAIDNASGGAFNTGYAGVSGSSFGGSNSAALDNVRLSGSTTVANGGDLRVIGTLTLDNGSVTLASDSSSTFLRSTSGAWSIAGNGSILFGGSHNAVRASNYLGYGSGAYSLSIGAGVTVAGSNGGYIYFGNNGANAGTIEAATAGREIVVNAWNNTDTWNNTGTLRANGGMLSLNDAWSSAGNGARIQLDSGTLFLGGSFSTASFNTLVRPADADRGALNLVGTLNNANATLNLNGATGTLNSGGTIAGGTLAIDNASGGAFNTGYAGVSGSSFGGSNSAALDNVRLSGSTTVANGGDLRVIGTLTLDNGSVTLASDSSSTFLRGTSGAWSIAGNGSILFGGSHNAVRANNYLGYGSGTYSLSIGAGVTVAGANGGYIYFGDNGANAGLIEAVTAGKEISLNAWSSNSSWTQSGTLHLANGGQFHVGDNFINSGVLRGAGNINASGRTITSTGLVHAEGGVLSVTGNLTQAAGSTLRFDIGGTERGTGHSALDVNGTFTFGGTLQVVHTNGFTPAASEAFPLIRYATRAGTSQFATLDMPAGSGYGSYYGAGTYLLARGAALNGEINEWISNASGDWSTGTNWSLGVAPNSATMSVLMDRVGFTPTVTISSGSWTIGELISQEHLTMTGGSLTVIGETAIAGQLTLNNASQLLAQGHLDLGTVTLNGSSQFIARNSGHIAEFRQNGGTSTFSGAGLAFDVFDIRGGTVNYDATLALPSQLLRIANYTANLNADQGQTLIQLQSGTLNLNLGSLSSDLDMSGGTLNVAGNTVSNGRLDWTGGNINGSGTLTQNGVMTITGNGSYGLGGGITLVHANSSGNSRMAKTGSYFYLNGSGTTLRNAAGAVLTLDSTDNTFGTYYSGGTGGLLQNQGTLIKTGAGVFRVNSPTRFEQAGLLDIRAGSIDLSYSTGNVFSGNTLIAADSALTLTGSQSTAFTGSARFSGAGLIQQNSGSTGIADGARIDSSLRLAGGTLGVTGTVRQNGAFTWTGGEINGGGTLAVSGVLEQSGNTTVYLRDATTLLHSNTSGNSRIANTSSSGLNIDSGSVFRNTGTLTLDVAGSGSIMYIDQDSGNAGLFDNTGTLIKTGSGRVDIGTYGLVSLRQAGALTINEGWMTLGGSGGTPPAHQISGSQSIASGALLQVTSGQTALASSAAFAGAGRLEVAGGTLTIGDGVQLGSDLALALSNGTLSVVGQLQQNSRFTWTGGQINGGGTLAVAGVFEQTGNTTVYLRDGTTLLHTNTSGDSRIANTSSSGFNIENGSTFRNTGTLKLDVASASGVMYIDQDGGNAGLFDNAGTLIKTGAGRLDIGTYGLVSLRQTGTLNVNAGWITFGGSGGTPPEHLLAGTQTIAAGARIDIDGGRTRLASSAVVSGAGPLRLTGGVLAMDDGMTTGITLQQSGGTLSGTGSNTLSGRYEWTGGTVGGSGVLTVSGALQISGSGSFGLDGRSLRHTNAAGSSSIYKTGGYLYVSNGATFTNAAGAALYIDTAGGNSGVWYGGTAGSFVNDGLLVKQGNGTFNFWNPVRLSNTGTLTVAQGTLFADNFTSNSGTLHTLSGAVLNTGNTALTNTGTVSGHGTLVIGGTGLLNRGIVAPGGSNEDGTLRITGHYTQAADGTLQIERGTPGTDALVVSGTATLGGTLTVSSLTGYTPTTLQSDIVSAGTLTGSFSTVTLPSGYSTLAVGNRQVLSYAGAICGGICWDGGAGTNLWTDAANWTGDLLPGLTSLVFIDLQNGVSVLLNSGTHTVASLTTTAGNTLTLAGGSLTLSGGASGQNASTLAGNLNISGGTLTANAATSIARLALSAGTLGGSGAITFNGAGSSWTGGDITGSGNTILAAGSTLDYAAGTRSTARRLDIRQGGTLRHLSGVLTLTGGASNAGVIDVAQGVTARYGGSATYLLDSSGQFAGGGRIEFINSAQATAASTAPTIAESTFTVRVQDSARFTATAPTAIARLELADSAQVTAQAGLQAGTLTQTGGTLTVNAASAVGQYSWAGGTLAGTGALTLLGNGSWTRGTLSGNLVIGNGATLTLSSTGSDDVQGTSYKRFGTGSLSNFGTLAWQEGHIDVVGNARVDNHGLLDISGNFSFGDRSVGVGTITLNNHAGALIRKNGGGETSIGSLGIPGGTANYAVVTNDGEILVGSGSLRFGVGYAGAPGGGSFIHNGQIDVVAGALLEFGGSLTHNGYTFIDSGATLRRIGGFTNTANGTIQGFGTLDVGNGNTLRNDGTLQVGDVFNGVNTHGTMQVTGNYLQGSGGRLLMAVGGNAAGQYDRLAVSGSATLGGSLVVSEAAGYARDSVAIDLITANGGLSGSLGTVTLPFEGYAVAQGANALRLNYAAIVCGGICWDGGAGTNLWTDAANWTGNVLPGLNDLVFINLGAGGQVRLTGGDQRIAALNTGAGSTLTISGGALTITGLSGSSSVASAVAGDVVLTGGTLTVGGQASFASLRQSGGFSQFDGIATVSRLALSGGEGVTLRTNGRLTVSDDFDWRDQADLDGAGTFTTAGLTTVTGSGGLGFGISVDWHNTGTVNLANGALLHFYSTSDGNGGALINEAGGVIDLSGGNALALGTHSGPLSRFVNAGTLIKRSGGDQRLEGNYSFENLGTVQVDGGRLDIRVSNADGGADTGRYVSNATLAFGAGQRILAAGSDIAGNGAVEFSGARVTVNGDYGIAGTGNTRISAGRADFASALTFANTLIVRGGVLNFNGDTVLNRLEMGWSVGDPATYAVLGGTGALTFTGSNSTITDGTLASGVVSGYDTGVGPLYVQMPATPRSVTVASGASLTFGGSEYADLSGISLNNQGTLSLVGNIHIHLDNTLDNAGRLELGSTSAALERIADVAWIAPGSLLIRNTGELVKQQGNDAFAAATLINSGTVELAAGTLQLGGNYVQEAPGTLVSVVGSAGPSRLHVDGSATLGGTLEVREAAGYNRIQLNKELVSANGGISGAFAARNLPADYTLSATPNRLNLNYTLLTCGGICWDGGAGTSNWMDAANWTGDLVPGIDGLFDKLVFINLATGANVVLNASPMVTILGLTIGNGNSFTLNSGVLNAPTTVQAGGTLTLQGGTLNSGGLFSNTGTANLAGGALNASQLSNSGTMNLSGSVLTAGLITNNGTMNLLAGTPANLTSTRFNNNGLIVADTHSTLEFGSGGGMIFANNGDVQVRSGTLSVLAHDTDASGPGADTGDYSVDAGASLRFRDAFRDFGPGSSITGAGNVEFTAFSGGAFNVNGVYSVGGTTRVSGNTLVNFNSNANFGTLDVAGNIGGGGTLNVGNLTWTSGSIGGAGRSIVVSGSTAMDGSSLTLNGARLTVAGSGLIDADTQLALNAGAQLIVGSGATLGLGNNSVLSGNGSVVNRGTLQGTMGTVGQGSSTIGVLLSNSGTVNASNGTLGLTGGIRTSAGSSFVVGRGATMELGGELPDDIFDQIQLNGGALSFSSAVQPVINRSFSAQAGTPFVFSLRSGATLRSGPLQGALTGQAAGWTYTAPDGFNGRQSAVFELSSGGGTALINVVFNVVSVPAVTTPIVQQVTVPLLQEVFQPPRMNVPSAPQVSAPVSIASLDALDNIATASGPQMEQPLRDFRGSRLQCR